jgi:DNA-binding GntR family transcriptional regulator
MPTMRTLGLFLLVLGLILGGGWVSCSRGTRPEDFEWTTIDENYTPKNYVEEYIKNDAEQKGIFPVYLRNYGKDQAILKRFRGTNFARPTEAALNIAFRGLEDWMLVTIKYQNNKKQEISRTVLYVEIGGVWRNGDSGSLLK